MFTHFLITRFNIQVSKHGPEKMDSPDTNIEWLNYRLRLFIKYCAPSVLNQSNKNFTWLIYMNSNTPASILDQMEYLKQNPHINFIFLSDYPAMLNDIISRIKNVNTPFVITTRLDNDDIVSMYFIRDIQKLFRPVHQTMINFTAGFEYSILDCVLRKWNLRFNNPFSSLIEDKDSPSILSIYGFAHWQIPRSVEMINVRGESYWMYLRHELNYSGSVYTGIPIFLKLKQLDMFPDSVRSIPISWFNTIKYGVGWFPKVIKRRSKNSLKKMNELFGMKKST